MFQKAVKHESKLRLAITGPSGAGKTYTSLRLARSLGRTAVLDTERGSASKYADEFDFDVLNLDPPYHPDKFLEVIHAAEKAGYDVLVIDSLSHAWSGPGGLLELVDSFAKRSKSGNSFAAWKEGTPIQNKLIDGLTRARIHIIGTMRSKTEYVLETGSNGKQAPKKVGTAPIQRDGMEYEFDVVLDMTPDNEAIVSKTRCSALAGKVFTRPGEDVAEVLKGWLKGEKAPVPQPQTQASQPTGQRGNPADLQRKAKLNRLTRLRTEMDAVYNEDRTIDAEASAANTRTRFEWWKEAGEIDHIPTRDGKVATDALTPDELDKIVLLYEGLKADSEAAVAAQEAEAEAAAA